MKKDKKLVIVPQGLLQSIRKNGIVRVFKKESRAKLDKFDADCYKVLNLNDAYVWPKETHYKHMSASMQARLLRSRGGEEFIGGILV